MLEVRQLRYFMAVAEELHFGRAAARLRVAQPALSRQIQAVEAGLGVTLFDRTQRRVALTAAGEVLRERARGLLDLLGEAEADTRRAAAGEIGRLVIGFVHSATYGVLPDLLRRFRADFPDVQVVLREMRTPDQLIALLGDEIDLAVVRPSILPKGITAKTIFEEVFMIALPAGHHLSGEGAISLSALRNEPFVMFSESDSPMFHSAAVAMCGRVGFHPAITQEATHVHTVVGLVSAGFGVAIVPATAHRLSVVGVVYANIQEAPPPIQLLLAWSVTRQSPPVSNFLIKLAHADQRTEKQVPQVSSRSSSTESFRRAAKPPPP